MVNYTDEITVGPVPSDEPCAQLGERDYELRARRECERFITLIREKLGPEPAGAKLMVKRNHHDFGLYYEVEVRYDRYLDAAVDYAFTVDAKAPQTWEG